MNKVKKLISIVTAVCLGIIGMLSIASCGEAETPVAGKTVYYLYDVESGVYDKTEYLEIDGDECKLVKNTDGVTVTATGTITFRGDKFKIRCTSELLGVQIITVFDGARESAGVLRVDSQIVSGMTTAPVTENEVMYYCLDGSKPASSTTAFTVTFDANGGKFENGKASISVMTDKNGRVAFPANPTRSGYVFDGFFESKTGNGAALTSNAVFERSKIVYARWHKKGERTETYYFYSTQTDEITRESYVEIDGDTFSCVEYDGDLPERLDGTVTFDGNKFTATVRDEDEPEITLTIKGEREKNGVLYINKMGIDGYFEDVIMYYCPDGVKPIDPQFIYYEITFSAYPGKFSDNTQSKVVKTDKFGKVVMPEDPMRGGYVFKGFKSSSSSEYVNADTVFTNDVTVYADFAVFHTVTFRVEGETVETREVEDGKPLGKINVPDIPEGNDYHMFKGWFDDYLGIEYNSYSRITRDMTLDAEFYTHQDSYEADMSVYEWAEPGHFYIHYRRDDQTTNTEYTLDTVDIKYLDETYDDWILWAWPDGGVGRAFEPIRIGLYGIVFDIDMKKTYTDGGWDPITKAHNNERVNYYKKGFNFQVCMDSSRQKDEFWKNDGGNNSLPREVFDWWEEGHEDEVRYLFDDNFSVHLYLWQNHVPDAVVYGQIFLRVYGHDNKV